MKALHFQNRLLFLTSWRVVSLFSIGMMAAAGSSTAQTSVEMAKVGIWNVHCSRGEPKAPMGASGLPSTNSCAVVTGVVANDDPDDITKVGFSHAEDGLELTVRTPRLKHFRQGVSVHVDAKELGRAFVDTCADDGRSCDFTAKLDTSTFFTVLSGKKLGIEYRLTPEKGVRWSIDLVDFKEAITVMYTKIGISGPPSNPAMAWRLWHRFFGSDSMNMVLDVVRNSGEAAQPATTNPISGRVATCGPRSREVRVSLSNKDQLDIKLSNKEELDRWIDEEKECLRSSVYVIRTPPNGLASQQANLGWEVGVVTKAKVATYLKERGFGEVVIADGPTNTLMQVLDGPGLR